MLEISVYAFSLSCNALQREMPRRDIVYCVRCLRESSPLITDESRMSHLPTKGTREITH